MISKWETELKKHGYTYKKYSSSEKAYVKYINNFIEHQIWEDRITQMRNKIVINTNISVRDPFVDEESHDYHVVIGGRLSDDGVVIPRSDTGVGRFWDKEEGTVALDALLRYALPWFEANNSIERLIEHVNNDVVVWPVSNKSKSCSSIKELLLSVFQNKQPKVEMRVKPISHLKLSLLYYHIGRIDSACMNAKMWVKHCSNLPGEPDRTLRQLKEMGCFEVETPEHECPTCG